MKVPRMRPRYYTIDAEHRVRKANVEKWTRWFIEEFETNDRVVGQTLVAPGVGVSTVFLGIDRRFFGKGPPLTFETMIFGGPLHEDQWRYSSWDDAETGHKAAVRKARAAQRQKVK